MVIATQPAVVAGGMTICTRSPVGSDADSSGDVASMRCCVELATSLANRLHQSKSANGSGFALPALAGLEKRFQRTVDAQLHHVRVREQRPQRAQREVERGRCLAGASGRRRDRSS